jgi:hypothetical protein
MNRMTAGLLAIGLGIVGAAGVSGPAFAHGGGGHSVADADARLLATARAASAKYHDVNMAIADGFAATDACAELPGVGGMGYHYVNMANLLEPGVDPANPEILLFVQTQDGLRLAGVEYMAIDADQDITTDGDRPSLFGVLFDGPMPGHEPGMPVHYDLHAWVWLNNPDGLFAAWNPRAICPAS